MYQVSGGLDWGNRESQITPGIFLNLKLGSWHDIKYRVGCGNETDKD